MKKAMILTVIVVFFQVFCFYCIYKNETYKTVAIITEITETAVSVKDTKNNIWEFYTDDVESFQIGEEVSMTMFTNHTKNLQDDEVLSVQKIF